MALNFWECEHPGCTVTATGTGGAKGLHAIGWYFAKGPVLLCPAHRPDPTPCHEDDYEGSNRGNPCSACAGDAEADMIQHAIEHHIEDMRAWWAAQKLIESKD
jgi:hypothetical protein